MVLRLKKISFSFGCMFLLLYKSLIEVAENFLFRNKRKGYCRYNTVLHVRIFFVDVGFNNIFDFIACKTNFDLLNFLAFDNNDVDIRRYKAFISF
jgi:hypothetical protein